LQVSFEKRRKDPIGKRVVGGEGVRGKDFWGSGSKRGLGKFMSDRTVPKGRARFREGVQGQDLQSRRKCPIKSEDWNARHWESNGGGSKQN